KASSKSGGALVSATAMAALLSRRLSLFRRVFDRVETCGLESKQIPRLHHVRRQRRGNVDHAATRVRDRNAPCQQVQPVLDTAGNLPVLLVEVFWIANDRMADVFHVSAQLMRAPG